MVATFVQGVRKVVSVDISGTVVTPATDAPEGSATGGTAGTASELAGGIYNSTQPTLTNGQQAALQLDASGNQRVALTAGTSTVAVVAGQAGGTISASSTTNALKATGLQYLVNGSAWFPNSFGTTASRIPSSAASNNATVAKASAGLLKRANGYNTAATTLYLKLYNKATAPTVGTDTPVLTLALPATSTFDFSFNEGFYFATGIGYGMVTGAADADNTGVAAGDVLGLNVVYA